MKLSHTWEDIQGKEHKVYKVQYLLYDASGQLYKAFKQEKPALAEYAWYNEHEGQAGFSCPMTIKIKHKH